MILIDRRSLLSCQVIVLWCNFLLCEADVSESLLDRVCLLQVDSRPGRRSAKLHKTRFDQALKPYEKVFGESRKDAEKANANLAEATANDQASDIVHASLLQKGIAVKEIAPPSAETWLTQFLAHFQSHEGQHIEAFTVVVIAIVLLLGFNRRLSMGLFVYFYHRQRSMQEKPRSAPSKQVQEDRPATSPKNSQQSHEALAMCNACPPDPSVRALEQRVLCKELVVPEGTECLLAVPVTGLETTRRSHRLFAVTDKKGKTLFNVALKIAKGPAGHIRERLTLQSVSGQDSLASCDVLIPVLNCSLDGSKLQCTIESKAGDMFGSIDYNAPKVGEDSRKCYEMVGAGGTWHMSFYGNLADHSLNVTNDKSQLLGVVEPASLHFGEPGSYYQLHVAPSADAGLILIALLALDRMQSASSQT